MRNIHIFKTDKLTRLHGYAYGELGLSKKHLLWKEGRNIYITNDEQVNRYDYYINNNECIQAMLVPVTSKCKKIILTTDRDLIENGVQSIDDEFLEWFINNPSCEFIKTYPLGDNKYDMVIPQVAHKEEPKQDLRQFPLTPDECYKQETLEEAAESYANTHQDVSGNLGKYLVKAVFQDGAQWQQERMYTEEHMKHAYTQGARLALISQTPLALYRGKFATPEEWFNDIKKL